MKYSKTRGCYCWWLKVDGKSVASFDDESDVDDIIKMEAELMNEKRLNYALEQRHRYASSNHGVTEMISKLLDKFFGVDTTPAPKVDRKIPIERVGKTGIRAKIPYGWGGVNRWEPPIRELGKSPQEVVSNAPAGAKYWSPVVEQYFDSEYRSYANRSVAVVPEERSHLVNLIDLKNKLQEQGYV